MRMSTKAGIAFLVWLVLGPAISIGLLMIGFGGAALMVFLLLPLIEISLIVTYIAAVADEKSRRQR